MPTITVGSGDTADHVGDLIITFVDGAGLITTDGSRPPLPTQAWGCYEVAPSLSGQPGCVVTYSGTPPLVQWESLSLVFVPPPYVPTQWTMAGEMDASAGILAAPQWPATHWTAAATLGASAGISGNLSVRPALSGTLGAAAGLSGTANAVLGAAGSLAGAAGISGLASGPGYTTWPVSAVLSGTAGISGSVALAAASGGIVGAAAGVSGNANTTSHFYQLAGTLAASAGVSGNANVGHQYTASGKTLAVAGVIPFGGNAPVRVTNYIRNPACVGAVTGSATLPDQWSYYSGDLTMTVIGQGTENGIPYTDFRFNNAASGGGSAGFEMEGALITGPGSTWSFSSFIRLVGGSTTNIYNMQLVIASLDSNFGGLGTYYGPTFLPTSAGLATQWNHFDGVYVNDAGTAYTANNLNINFAAGAVDFTIRIGAPNVERAVAASGSQYIVVPQTPAYWGGSTSFVY